jgi:hypothetical protein
MEYLLSLTLNLPQRIEVETLPVQTQVTWVQKRSRSGSGRRGMRP